jgi:outer membrane protein OmpA-like peptidoglycan-associated protein
MELNIPLQPIEAGGTVVLENVFFDTDKFVLRDESRVELQKLIEFLNFNKLVKIQISGHTDNTGDKQRNILLSNNRAKAVTEYLISKGIDKDRLSFKGYGDSKPVVPNDSEAHKAMNRRTEFMIL